MTVSNRGLAAVLCFFYTGLGQIYNGELAKGLFLLAVRAVSDLVLIPLCVGWLTSPLIWIYGMYDAYHGADRTGR